MVTVSIKSFIWMCALASGTVFFLLMVFSSMRKRDIGYASFLYTLIPGYVYVCIELLFLVLPNTLSPFLSKLLLSVETFVFLSMGISCVLFYKAQYDLYALALPRYLPFSFLALLSIVNFLLSFSHLFFPGLEVISTLASTAIVYLVLSHAGIATVSLLRVANRLTASGWAGVASAGLGLVYFPFFFIADLFHLEIPHITSVRPVRLQAYALYYLLVCLIIFVSFISLVFSQRKTKRINDSTLTRRESELARLLYTDLSAAEIAETLSISLSTVKTHTINVYKKLDVHSREELRSRTTQGGLDA